MEVPTMRLFARIVLIRNQISDETTILAFRQLLDGAAQPLLADR
jgi:hypothetical protein